MGSSRGVEVVKGYVETEEGQIHYRRCGPGPPSILLLHATPNSSAMFVSALKRFGARGLHAVALDLPNCGESYFTAAEPKVPDIAEAVLQAVHALKFSIPFDIIGHQTGATIGLQIAAEVPEAVRKLVLWAVPILGFMQRGDVLREEPPDYDGNFMEIIQTFVDSRYPEPVPWQLKVRSLIDMLQTYDRRPWTTRAMALIDHEALLKRLSMPVLCMGGDNEPFQKATMKAALICGNGKYVNFGTAGSDVVDEIPDDYVAEVLGFLHSHGVPSERQSWSIASEVVLVDAGRKMSTAEGEAVVRLSGGRKSGEDDNAGRLSGERKRLSLKGLFKSRAASGSSPK